MDLKKIFIKEACPTKIGGQAVLEGLVMKGENRSVLVVRKPGGRFHIRIRPVPPRGLLQKIPFLRGIFIFLSVLISGIQTIMYSAEILEEAELEEEHGGEEGKSIYEKDKLTIWLEKHFGEKGAFNMMLIFSIILSIVFTVGIFIIAPTLVVNFLSGVVNNNILLNLIEGVFRILLFVLYVLLISRMKDIQNVFQYHGAEHKAIHCYENQLPLTPDNCQQFETLHPRCGTSFLMFVLVISLLLFSLLGWPNAAVRIASRILLLPVIAGISYELLRWAGNGDSILIKILSLPGLALQKLTTAEPEKRHLEVAIIALNAVLSQDMPKRFEGETDIEGNLYAIPKRHRKTAKKQQKLNEAKTPVTKMVINEGEAEPENPIGDERKRKSLDWVYGIDEIKTEEEITDWGFEKGETFGPRISRAPWEKDEFGRSPWSTEGYDPFEKKREVENEESPWGGYDLFSEKNKEEFWDDDDQISWDLEKSRKTTDN
ncbi:MAG: DUF1385 domain-containing protein [Anaerovoracaceae bacterium]|jgi:uncharacterized protein YqhQ